MFYVFLHFSETRKLFFLKDGPVSSGLTRIFITCRVLTYDWTIPLVKAELLYYYLGFLLLRNIPLYFLLLNLTPPSSVNQNF